MEQTARFCQLILQINKLQTNLDKERNIFYDGGYSFESVFKCEHEELEALYKEFMEIQKDFTLK